MEREVIYLKEIVDYLTDEVSLDTESFVISKEYAKCLLLFIESYKNISVENDKIKFFIEK